MAAVKRRLLALAALALLLSGCWGLREINELALVLGVGIDRTPEGRVRVTVQAARPGAAGPAAGQTAGGSGGSTDYIAAAEGRSIFEAIRNLALFTSRRIMWAHNQVVIIGAEQARAGVQEIVDFFTRNPELRYRTLVAVAAGEAREILGQSTGMEAHPANSIAKVFRYSELIGETRRADIKGLAAAHMDQAVNPALPVLRLAPRLVPGTANKEGDPREVLAQGVAVFRDGKLVAIFTQQESRGLALVRGEAGRLQLTLPCPGQGPEAPMVLELTNLRTGVEPAVAAGRLRFTLRLTVDFSLSALTCVLNYQDPQVQQALERAAAQSLTRDMAAAVARAQATRTDPFGLGQYLRARQPDAWARLREQWPDPVAGAAFDIQVRARLRGGEMLLLPTPRERGGAGR